jgi:hypothetical protein
MSQPLYAPNTLQKMKSTIKISTTIILLSILVIAMQSCVENDTKPDFTAGLTKVASGYAAATKIEVFAEQELFAGYNRVFLLLHDSASGKHLDESVIRLNPQMQMATMKHSCPVEDPVATTNGLFAGAILFSMPSGDMGTWTLEVAVDNPLTSKSGKVLMDINVKPVTPPQLHSFTSDDGEKYLLSYYFPEKAGVGMNELEVIIFTREGDRYLPAEDLSIKLTPEMPSMDHGSPNNEDPVHQGKGHYRGKVNFTMTGEWRLNLEMSKGDGFVANKFFDVNIQ